MLYQYHTNTPALLLDINELVHSRAAFAFFRIGSSLPDCACLIWFEFSPPPSFLAYSLKVFLLLSEVHDLTLSARGKEIFLYTFFSC